MWMLLLVALLLRAVAVYDISQRRHTILRNFPVIGHLRFWVEAIGPHLRQYIVADNNEGRPPGEPDYLLPCAKVLGQYRGRCTAATSRLAMSARLLECRGRARP